MGRLGKINGAENVREQYADGKNLTIRQGLHEKHSTNRYGLHNWIWDQYQWQPGSRILELGCGTGAFWENRVQKLPPDSVLVLSDLSESMVAEAWGRVRVHPGVLAQQMDIQSIPFPADSFDAVIANHMLYHVPDLKKAMTQAHRVLRPGGAFYCVTNGTQGMSEYLHHALKEFNPAIDAFGPQSYSFTLQNGGSVLEPPFSSVRLAEYADSLRVTQTQDLVDWIESTLSIAELEPGQLTGLYEFFEERRGEKGYIEIPKQVGMFIAQKA